MLLSDKEIKGLVESHGMIKPFSPKLIRSVEEGSCASGFCTGTNKVISYGLASYGYDIRLSPKDFRIFRHQPGKVVDPKNFKPEFLEKQETRSGWFGDYFVIPAHSYGLGVAIEYLNIPRDISVICIGKSTYARSGIIANITPAEAGWKGHLTLEFSNSSSADVQIYANEGVVQLLFFQGTPCETDYQDRSGKYQNQSEEITLAKL